MRGSTHLAGGLLAGVVVGLSPAGIVLSGVAALYPDWFQVAVPGLRIKGATGHRGFSHWLITALVMTALVWLAWRDMAPYVLMGYISHLALDMLTERGAPVLWPLPFQISLLPIHEGGAFDKWLGAALVVIANVVAISKLLK